MEIQIGSIKQFVILIITFYGFLLSALISIGHIIADGRSVKTWFLLGLFLVFSLHQIHFIFFEMNLLAVYRVVNIFPVVAIFLLGPVMFFITRQSLLKNYKITPLALIHFIPAAIASILSLVFVFSPDNQVSLLLSGYFYNQKNILLGTGGWLVFVIYLGLSIRDLTSYHILSKQTILNNPSALVVFIIVVFFILTSALETIAYLSNQVVFLEASILILSLLIISLFLVNFKYPGYYKTLHDVVEKERKKRSYLKGINFSELSRKLDALMEKE